MPETQESIIIQVFIILIIQSFCYLNILLEPEEYVSPKTAIS